MLQFIYLLLCVLGFALPYSQFVPWLLENGLNLPLFVELLFVNRVSAMFGWDLLVAVVVLFVWFWTEGTRLRMRHLWVYGLGTLTIGVAFGLPLFLLMRQRHLEQSQAKSFLPLAS